MGTLQRTQRRRRLAVGDHIDRVAVGDQGGAYGRGDIGLVLDAKDAHQPSVPGASGRGSRTRRSRAFAGRG